VGTVRRSWMRECCRSIPPVEAASIAAHTAGFAS
jgi:hypothetical protein